MLQIGIMIHSLVIGLTLAITTGSEFSKSHTLYMRYYIHIINACLPPPPYVASLVAAIIFHQLFEGLSLGIRIANLPRTPLNGISISCYPFTAMYLSDFLLAKWIRRAFKPTLAFTFAITTPVGIAIGLAAFGHGKADAGTSIILPPLSHYHHSSHPCSSRL